MFFWVKDKSIIFCLFFFLVCFFINFIFNCVYLNFCFDFIFKVLCLFHVGNSLCYIIKDYNVPAFFGIGFGPLCQFLCFCILLELFIFF